MVEIMLFEREWVTLSANFRGKGGHPPTSFGVRKVVPGLSRGVVCVILRFAVLIQYRRVTDRHRQTDRQTCVDGYYPRRASSALVNTNQRTVWAGLLAAIDILPSV